MNADVRRTFMDWLDTHRPDVEFGQMADIGRRADYKDLQSEFVAALRRKIEQNQNLLIQQFERVETRRRERPHPQTIQFNGPDLEVVQSFDRSGLYKPLKGGGEAISIDVVSEGPNELSLIKAFHPGCTIFGGPKNVTAFSLQCKILPLLRDLGIDAPEILAVSEDDEKIKTTYLRGLTKRDLVELQAHGVIPKALLDALLFEYAQFYNEVMLISAQAIDETFVSRPSLIPITTMLFTTLRLIDGKLSIPSRQAPQATAKTYRPVMRMVAFTPSSANTSTLTFEVGSV